MEYPKTKKILRVWRWAALLSLLLAVATAWIVFDDLFSPFGEKALSVEIPDLCGKTLVETELADWMDTKIEYRYDGQHAAGVILAQSPAGGSRRKLTAQHPQCELKLTVSLGEQTVTLPDVIGKDRREVEVLLREKGLAVQIETVAGAYEEGTVFAMEPRVGTEVPVGSKVTLSVSAGTPSQTVTVPDVRGLSRSDALVQLWLAQLAVGDVIEVDADAEGGTVIRQSHQGGTLVRAGTKVTLYVSREWEE